MSGKPMLGLPMIRHWSIYGGKDLQTMYVLILSELISHYLVVVILCLPDAELIANRADI